MVVIINRSARLEIAEIEAWWIAHRPKAPMLFTEELEAAIERLGSFPYASLDNDDPTGTRRVLLHRSGYTVYFEVEGHTVRIIAVVGGSTLGRPRR